MNRSTVANDSPCRTRTTRVSFIGASSATRRRSYELFDEAFELAKIAAFIDPVGVSPVLADD